jgi:signal peptide peptidase-like protein 2B
MTGLLITYVALNLMDGHGQPALLYIVPFTLGNFCNSKYRKHVGLQFGFIYYSYLINLISYDAGTFLTLGRKRGDLKVLWTRGEPERPCPHIQFQHCDESHVEK